MCQQTEETVQLQRITQVHQPAYPDIPCWHDPNWFYSHPVIQEIANTPTWTMSGRSPKSEKVPVDAWEYADTNGKIVGAKDHSELYLMTLPQVYQTFYNETAGMRNKPYVHFLDWQQDGYVCLDIEPTCDPELRNKFLRLPFSYGEFSLSGKGFHLLFKVPKDIFQKYPDAMKKVKMQDKSATFEILLYHYMTFTQNMLLAPQDPLPIEKFYQIFEELCQQQAYSAVQREFQAELILIEDIPAGDLLLKRLQDVHNKKQPDEYPTPSHYEYGTISTVMHGLYKILQNNKLFWKNHAYTDAELVMIIYYRVIELLEHREKHDTLRNGVPYLIFAIQNCVAKNPLEIKI